MEGSAFSVTGRIYNELGKFRFAVKALKTAILRKREILGNEASGLCPDLFSMVVLEAFGMESNITLLTFEC